MTAGKGGGWERRREGSLESSVIKEECLVQMQNRLEQYINLNSVSIKYSYRKGK